MEAANVNHNSDELMMDACIQPEVILVEGEGSSDPTMIYSNQDTLTHLPVKVEIGGLSHSSGTIPLPHLLNAGGSWHDGNMMALEGSNDENVNDQRFEEEGNIGVNDEDHVPNDNELDGLEPDCDNRVMEVEESVESHPPQLQKPTLRPRVGIFKKRGRKGMPRKAALTAAMSRQQQQLLNVQNSDNFAVAAFEAQPDNDNPNLFQVALKMTMRTEEERKSLPFLVPMSMQMPTVKRASLSLQDKINIIQELATGEKQSAVCKKQGLPKSTVQSIWKNREKIQGAVEKIGMDRKRCRRAQHEDVEDKLVEWINNLKAQSVPVNGPQLRAKAQVMAKQMGLTEFRCSTGWLDKFKTRHRIIFKKNKSSPRNVIAGDKKVALDWITKVWPALCEGYPPCDIFNVDEAGIFYKSPPDKAVRLRSETCHGGKMSKDRITILLCTNSEGTEKLKINAVGNIANPQSFVGIPNLENLPAVWHYNQRSWLTRDIFVSWLRNWDELLRSTDRQIILILDNSPAHETTEQFTNIKLVFLPPTVASIIQPLEHGVIASFKLHYRRLLLDRMIRKAEQGSSRTISILEALIMLGTAWTEVSPELITDCFRTSNLQSLMVPDMGIGSNGAASDYDMLLANDPKLLQQAIRVGIPIPDNVSFKEYSLIDSSLHVTDYINESGGSVDQGISGSEKEPEEDFVQPLVVPRQRDVQQFIDGIRNWAMLSTANCDTGIHTALSVLESYALRAKPPDTMTNSTIEVDVGQVGLTTEQEIPVSVIVTSQNGGNNGGGGGGGSNLTLTTFDASQQMVQIPISIHSQSTELVTLTTLEPAPTEDLDGLGLEGQGHSPRSNSAGHSQETHVQHTMHFQHDQHQPQFFAYLG